MQWWWRKGRHGNVVMVEVGRQYKCSGGGGAETVEILSCPKFCISIVFFSEYYERCEML